MTPIERAARAMYDTVRPDWDWDDPDAELLRRMYRENARAVLVAIRSPSPDQCRIGQDAVPSASHETVETIWTAMVDMALSQG